QRRCAPTDLLLRQGIPDMLLEHDRKLVVLIRRSAEALAEVVSNEASHQQPRLVMRRDHGIADMVRGMVVGNTSLSSTRWKRMSCPNGER
ncbi:MAG: hypothetical protein J7456_13450, partial [Chloroflexus sp.]|nr:hypothetical protein [Chloroflexus sp.]